MTHTSQHMMQGTPSHMFLMWVVLALVVLLVVAAVVYLVRPARSDRLLVAELSGATRLGHPQLDGEGISEHELAHDTIFILPDISNYTRFMTGSHFAFAHAQYIIFCLINSMIDSATRTVRLSKLEGDAALFFVDAHRHSDTVIGETVMSIFRSFFRERRRLEGSNICPCRACQHISELDLKIFVHRGRAARFEFRGSVDHFGTDVIVLHRLMKNSVSGHRYVMVTDDAQESVAMPENLKASKVFEDIEHFGRLSATVFNVDDETIDELLQTAEAPGPSIVRTTFRKLRENIHSLRRRPMRFCGHQ